MLTLAYFARNVQIWGIWTSETGVQEVPQRILWLCPFPLATVPPPELPEGIEFIVCHHPNDLAIQLAALDAPYVEAVVIDTSPVPGHQYDPVKIATIAADKMAAPPHYLITAVRHGVDADPIGSQMAFVVELHELWQRKPVLVIEEAISHYLEKLEDVSRAKGEKDSRLIQVQHWGTIAMRACRFVRNELRVESQPVPPLTRAFVIGMCAKARSKVGTYFNQEQRRLLYALSQDWHNVESLAGELHRSEDGIRKVMGQITQQLYVHSPLIIERGSRPDNIGFCSMLAYTHAPWLLSHMNRTSSQM